MFILPIPEEPFAVLTPDGIIQYSGPGFADLAADSETGVEGTDITTWLEPVKPSGAGGWYCWPEQSRGTLLQVQTQKRLRYRLEPMENGSVLHVRKEQGRGEIEFDDLYSRAFHLNPGLSAITIMETGKHLDVNTAWLDALGYQRSEVIGKTARELNIWEKGDDARNEIILELKTKGRIHNHEAKMRTKDGRLLNILVSAELLDYHGLDLAFFASHDVTRITTEISRRKKTEKELKEKGRYLEQANLALKSMLDFREAEKRAIEGNTFLNIKNYILPYLDEIEKNSSSDGVKIPVEIIKTSIKQLMSPASEMLYAKYADLTPMEVKVADMVKQGMRTKEIGEFLNIAGSSVSTYRNNIRRKFGLLNKKTNLKVYLNSLQA